MSDNQIPDESWKYEKSCWIAVRGRGSMGPDVYWGPFETYADIEDWAKTLNFAVGFIELKDPDSDESTWWN